MEPQTKPAPPVMDVIAPPESIVAAPPESAPEAKPVISQKKASPKTSPKAKRPKSGVGLAIFATVIIVLGLAAMATFAYLKQTNSL